MGSRHTLRFIRESIGFAPGMFSGAVGLVLAVRVLLISIPWLIGRLVDRVIADPNAAVANLEWVIGFGGAISLALLLNPIQSYFLNRFVQYALLRHSLRWFQKILEKELSFFGSMQVGRIAHSTERGTAAHEKLLTSFGLELIPLAIEFVIAVIALCIFGGVKFISAVAAALLVQVLVSRFLTRMRRPQLARVNDSEDELAGALHEVLTHGLVLQLERAV